MPRGLDSREGAWRLLEAAHDSSVPDRVYPGLAQVIIAFELRHMNESLDYMVKHLRRSNQTITECIEEEEK